MESRRCGAYPLDDFSQETSSILKAAAVRPFTRVSAEELVTEVAVAVLDVNKIETELPGERRCDMKLFDDCFDVGIA